jgi:glycosyltransferase involved in cell wall biosynthesis
MISVVICCYNSSMRLPETLRCIAEQKVRSDLPWEVIIVDNASNDNTVQVARSVWNSLGKKIPFRIVSEQTPGLSSARKKAVFESSYPLILFCDDDNSLTETYIQQACDVMDSDPSIGIVGGLGIAKPEQTPPVWFAKYAGSYAVNPQAKSDGYLAGNKSLYGAGMVMRKQVLLDLYNLGFVSLLSGRKGESLSSGEDTEICLWYRFLGYKLFYKSTMVFIHYIPKERLTDNYYLRRSFEKGKAEAVFKVYFSVLNKSSLDWLNKTHIWYWNIFKRFFLYLYYRIRMPSFEHKVKRQVVWSSILFRWRNRPYLKRVASIVQTNTSLFSSR